MDPLQSVRERTRLAHLQGRGVSRVVRKLWEGPPKPRSHPPRGGPARPAFTSAFRLPLSGPAPHVAPWKQEVDL